MEANQMEVKRYEIRHGGGANRQVESFDTAEAAAIWWSKCTDPTATLFVSDEQHGLWPGTAAQVQPVYDALRKIRET